MLVSFPESHFKFSIIWQPCCLISTEFKYSRTYLIRPPFIRISLLSGHNFAKIFNLFNNNYEENGEFLLQNYFILAKTCA